jgi:hypothetical protein
LDGRRVAVVGDESDVFYCVVNGQVQVEEREARLLLVALRLERKLVERLASIGFVTLDHCYSRVVARRRVRVHNY